MLLHEWSLGVTGFDGLLFEKRATREMMLTRHTNASTNTCKQNCCKRKEECPFTVRDEGLQLCVRCSIRLELRLVSLRDVFPIRVL
jgi:hypothetical protein